MLNINLNSKEFIAAINTTKHFIGDKEEKRKVLRCIHFDFAVKGELSVVASNGRILARQRIPVDSAFRGSFSVPVETLKGLIPVLKTAKETSLTFDGDQLEVNSMPLDLYTDTKFPDYKRTLPALPVQGVLDVGLLKDALKSLKEQGRKPHNPQFVALGFNGQNLIIWKGVWGHTRQGGFVLAEQNHFVPAVTVEKTFRVFNINYLIAALKPLNKEVVLKFSALTPGDVTVPDSLSLESGTVTIYVIPVFFSNYKEAYENFLRTVQ